MRINATSVFVASREVYPHLKQAGGGMIVNIGSFFDKIGVKRNLAYCASKAAVGAITRCLAVEWAADNIRVLDVAPGYIDTDLNAEFREKDSVKAWIKRASRSPGPARRGSRAAGRRRCSAPTSASSPARPSTSTAARACSIDDDMISSIVGSSRQRDPTAMLGLARPALPTSGARA